MSGLERAFVHCSGARTVMSANGVRLHSTELVREQHSSAKERRRIARYVSGELDNQGADKKTVCRAANSVARK